MPDQRFFKKSKHHSLQEILEISGAVYNGSADLSFVIEDVSDLTAAQSQHVSFLDNAKYKDAFSQTRAGACFVHPDMVSHAPEHVICLESKNPYKSYALTAQAFYPDNKPDMQISDSASIDPTAKVGSGAYIGHNVVIGAGAEIGESTWIEANAVIQDNVKIGNHCRIGSGATVSHAIIGNYVRLYPGVRVGQDGFGFAIDPAGHVKVPQLGRVIIEDHVEIGANTTIDRGAGPDTIIGQGTWIDNLVQIGHNVKIGRGCVIVAQAGISGSTVLEDYVVVAGQAGVAGHLTIGMGARIAAQSGIMSDIPAGKDYMGSPAMPKTTYFRQVAALNRLIKRKKKD